MNIKTKFEIGQEVFFHDPHYVGFTPGKGMVSEIIFHQKKDDTILEYRVKQEEWSDALRFWEREIFSSLSEYRESMIQAIDKACKDYEEKN